MPRPRQTEIAVLGALSVEPMTGYAIRDAIRDVLGHFWSESFGQIYPTLTALEESGMVTRSAGLRSRSSTYEITDSGRLRLRQLLEQPAARVPPRNGLMLRLFFGRTLGPERCRHLLEQTVAEAKDRLAMFAGLRAEIDAEATHPQDRPYWLFTVSAGEHTTRATIAWAEECLAAIDNIEAGAVIETAAG